MNTHTNMESALETSSTHGTTLYGDSTARLRMKTSLFPWGLTAKVP